MPNPVIPFGLLPVGLVPGWLLPGSGGYLLYRGLAADAVDYANPVGCISGDAATIVAVGLPHEVGMHYHYVLRRVSDAGVHEQNTHVRCVVHKPAADAAVETMLPRPAQLQASWHDGRVRLAWRVPSAFHGQRFDACEVLQRGQLGAWDSITRVPAGRGGGIMQWCGVLVTPAIVAVRVRVGQQSGPLSASLAIPAPTIPQSPQLL